MAYLTSQQLAEQWAERTIERGTTAQGGTLIMRVSAKQADFLFGLVERENGARSTIHVKHGGFTDTDGRFHSTGSSQQRASGKLADGREWRLFRFYNGAGQFEIH